MSKASMLLMAAALLTSACQAQADNSCTPVRPNGLTPDAVDSLIVQTVADAVGLSADRVDVRKSLRQIDPSDDVFIHYARIVVKVGEALAFDSAATFDSANSTTGKSHPIEGITIASMQELARKAYFAGRDSPPPPAPVGATFKTRRFAVAVPGKPLDWSLVACNSDQFAFRATLPDGLYTAVARDISMRPYTDADRFLADVRDAAVSLAPSGYTVKTMDVGLVKKAGPPCALLSAEVTAAGPSAPSAQGAPFLLYAQFCHDAKYPHLGYAALFSHFGQAERKFVQERAMAFIGGVNAAR